MADIFVSYTSSDREWAHWIARELEALGHTPRVHEWEIKGGDDIYAWMEKRHDAADHVLCVVSDEYLKAPYSALERNAALWQATAKRPGFVLIVAVRPCRLPTLSDHIRRCELFGAPEDDARLRFRQFMAAPRAEPGPTAFPGKVFAVSNIPVHVPEHFLGRDEALKAVRTALGRNAGRVAITALHGLRGVGKTTLAAAYADRHRADHRATWWVRAQTEPTMRADLVALGVRLKWVAADEKEEPALAAVMERLRHEGEGVLLIYDNAVDARSLGPYLPRGGAARVLVTSSAHDWRRVAEPVEIRQWPKEVGADYLLARTGRGAAERAEAEALSEALGGLPLAHEQAASYCERLGVPLAEYGRRFAAAPARLLDDARHAPAEYHDGLTVAKTFGLAIEEASKLHPAAEPLILHAALLAPEPIPLFLFSEGRAAFGEPLASLLAEDGLHEAVAALRTFALVDREAIADEREPTITTDTIRLHRLVREVAAARPPAEARDCARHALVAALAAIYPKSVRNEPRTWPRARRLDALALALVESEAGEPEGMEEPVSWLLDRLASYRKEALATYMQARPLLDRALAIREKALGPDHPDTAASLNSLGNLLQSQGDDAAARPLYERALAVREAALGPVHPDIAASLNNIANTLRNLGDLAGARLLFDRALAISEKALGPDHPDTATRLHNLAIVLHDQGALAGARHFVQRALAIREKALGPDHLGTAASLDLLAIVLHDQGDLAGARPLHERALAIREAVLGPDHPSTAASLNNLAHALNAQGDHAGARPLFERALAIYEAALGPYDLRTAETLHNVAYVLRAQGDHAAARPLLERGLAIFGATLGPQRPRVNLVATDFARILVSSNRPGEAASLGGRVLAAQEAALGAVHAWTKDAARVTARALDVLGRGEEASALRRRYGLS